MVSVWWQTSGIVLPLKSESNTLAVSLSFPTWVSSDNPKTWVWVDPHWAVWVLRLRADSLRAENTGGKTSVSVYVCVCVMLTSLQDILWKDSTTRWLELQVQISGERNKGNRSFSLMRSDHWLRSTAEVRKKPTFLQPFAFVKASTHTYLKKTSNVLLFYLLRWVWPVGSSCSCERLGPQEEVVSSCPSPSSHVPSQQACRWCRWCVCAGSAPCPSHWGNLGGRWSVGMKQTWGGWVKKNNKKRPNSLGHNLVTSDPTTLVTGMSWVKLNKTCKNTCWGQCKDRPSQLDWFYNLKVYCRQN